MYSQSFRTRTKRNVWDSVAKISILSNQPLTSTLLSLFSSSCEPPKKLEILLPISTGEKVKITDGQEFYTCR